jgi:hypothetical protein
MLGLRLFSFSAQITLFHVCLAFKVSVVKSAVIFDGFTFISYLFFLSYSLQYSFSVLCADLMIICCGEVLFWSSLFGVLEASCIWMGNSFFEIWKCFCYYFAEYITYPFGLHLFSFFNIPDSQVWSFDRVNEFLRLPFTALELFDSEFLCFVFNIYFIFKP